LIRLSKEWKVMGNGAVCLFSIGQIPGGRCSLVLQERDFARISKGLDHFQETLNTKSFLQDIGMRVRKFKGKLIDIGLCGFHRILE
jgi:hypothetical protein